MTKIPFHIMAGSGNRFIVIDNRNRLIEDPKQFAKKECKSKAVDGVLLVEKPKEKQTDFFMRIVNSDGSEAEACGNGYRCVGLYAHDHLQFPKFMRAGTLGGPIEISVNSPRAIKVKMVNPTDYRERIEITPSPLPLPLRGGEGKGEGVAFINTGVPHVVIFADGLDKIAVVELGRTIRYDKSFQPQGTNVNFVEVTGNNSLSVRTYERGVEDETLACGTGSVAAAIIANLKGFVEAPVEVLPKSGEKLKIYFNRSGNDITQVYLEGPAEEKSKGVLAV
ncbi:MAG: diaminopimelate epimerase [Candidatus Omnitrophica bacterium]|nr:diaminopimelate epimerase [Candidatus Omnitrophota bacterium]